MATMTSDDDLLGHIGLVRKTENSSLSYQSNMAQQVIVRCHCGQLTEKVQLRDKIPLAGPLCHCNICRHVTGAMTFSGVSLSSPPAELFKEKLIKYATSDKIVRYFCGTCGSHVCYYAVKDDRWAVCPGAIDKVLGEYNGKLEKHTGHEFVADTLDGGFSWCIPDIPSYMEDDGAMPSTDLKGDLRELQPAGSGNAGQGTVEAKCHCGHANFSIKPAEDGKKWEAGICACRSCRLSFSQSIVAWALNVPRDRVVWFDGSVFDGNPRQSLNVFQSSDDVQRHFCSNCGASVFYDIAKEPETVDVAFGILRVKDGSLARSFFEWDTKKVHHLEEAVDKDLLTLVKDNLEALKEV